MNDTKVFKTVIGKTKNRIKGLGLDIGRHTVAFDRGNNSKKNLATVKVLQLHYVEALTPYHHKKLVEDAMEDFQEIEVDGKGIHVCRDKRTIWHEERTVIVFISEKLKSGQIRGIYQSLEKVEKRLRELQESLCKPKAMKRKKEQLEDKITNIVKEQFVKDIIDWSLLIPGCHGIANKDGYKSLNKIGKELGGLTVGGMSQIRKRLKEKMQKDNSLRFKYNQCNKAFCNE